MDEDKLKKRLEEFSSGLIEANKNGHKFIICANITNGKESKYNNLVSEKLSRNLLSEFLGNVAGMSTNIISEFNKIDKEKQKIKIEKNEDGSIKFNFK